MIHKLTRVLFAVLLSAVSLMVCGQTDSTKVNSLDFGLNFMTHGEMVRGGMPVSSDAVQEDKSNFLLGRTRLMVDYKRPYVEANAVLQNMTLWGSHDNMALGLYEAWVKFSAIGLFGQVGRVALSYDDERIIGTNDFAMASLSHDVLRLGYEGYGHKAHVFLAYNQNPENMYADTYYRNGAQAYKSMVTAWYHYDVPKFPLGASLLFMHIGMQAGEPGYEVNPPHNVYQRMYGGYLNFCPKYVGVEASYYRQKGRMVDGLNMSSFKIDAWMFSGKVTVTPSKYYGFVLGYDHLSGDDYVPVPYGGMIGLPRHEVNKGFNPLYGSRTKFYGIMDYFYEKAYINGFTPGLQNAFFSVTGKPYKKLDLMATYHYLAVATHLDGLSNTLGHCVDVMASFSFTKDISLTAGYSLMFGSETMSRLKQGGSSKNSQWGWFSLIVSPRLFTTKF